MWHFSLLFAPTTQSGLIDAGAQNASSLIDHKGFAPPISDETRHTCTGFGDGPVDYRLPSGIASLEHWLDLNA